jgi:cytochrome c-type biogenesis protein CcmH/NrfF
MLRRNKMKEAYWLGKQTFRKKVERYWVNIYYPIAPYVTFILWDIPLVILSVVFVIIPSVTYRRIKRDKTPLSDILREYYWN